MKKKSQKYSPFFFSIQSTWAQREVLKFDQGFMSVYLIRFVLFCCFANSQQLSTCLTKINKNNRINSSMSHFYISIIWKDI